MKEAMTLLSRLMAGCADGLLRMEEPCAVYRLMLGIQLLIFRSFLPDLWEEKSWRWHGLLICGQSCRSFWLKTDTRRT